MLSRYSHKGNSLVSRSSSSRLGLLVKQLATFTEIIIRSAARCYHQNLFIPLNEASTHAVGGASTHDNQDR